MAGNENSRTMRQLKSRISECTVENESFTVCTAASCFMLTGTFWVKLDGMRMRMSVSAVKIPMSAIKAKVVSEVEE